MMHDEPESEMVARLTQAAKTRPDLPPGLMERVLADAIAVQLDRDPQPNVVPLHAAPRPYLGWVTASALAASAVFGLTLGYGATDALTTLPGLGDVIGSMSMTTATDSLGAFETFLSEG